MEGALPGTGYPFPAPPLPAAWPPPPPERYADRQVDRTKVGILSLFVAIAASCIPLPWGLASAVPFVVGAVCMVLGRAAYGRRHGQNVVVATFCIVVATAGLVTLRLVFALAPAWAAVSYPTNLSLRVQAVQTAFDRLMIGSGILGAVAGAGWVLFTHAFQDQKGRILLWTGFVWGVALNLAVYAYIRPIMSQAIADAFQWTFSAGPLNAAVALMDTLRLTSLVAVVPYVLAYARAYSRAADERKPAGLAVKQRPRKSEP